MAKFLNKIKKHKNWKDYVKNFYGNWIWYKSMNINQRINFRHSLSPNISYDLR